MQSKHFDKYFTGGQSYFKKEPTGFLVEWLKGNGGTNQWALDAGCGNGRNSIAIAAAGYRCLALDVSMGAIESLAGLVRRKTHAVIPILASLNLLPVTRPKFSFVFCGTSLSCLGVQEIQDCISQFYNVVLPGGHVLVSDFSVKDPGAMTRTVLPRSECASVVRTYFSEQLLRRVFDGFAISRIWEIEKTDRSHGPEHIHNMIRMIARKQ